jgi:hypothetical protein
MVVPFFVVVDTMTTVYDRNSDKSIRENPYLDYFTKLLYVAALTGETMLQNFLPLHKYM